MCVHTIHLPLVYSIFWRRYFVTTYVHHMFNIHLVYLVHSKMYICTYVCVCMCISFVFTRNYPSLYHTWDYIHIHRYTYTYTYVCTCVHTLPSAHLHFQRNSCLTYTYCTHTYACMYIRTYVRTYPYNCHFLLNGYIGGQSTK